MKFNEIFQPYVDKHPDDILATVLKSTIASKIILSRYNLHLSQKELADKIGITQPMIAKWENGDYNFTITQLSKVCVALNVDISTWFDVESNISNLKVVKLPWRCGENTVIDKPNQEIGLSA